MSNFPKKNSQGPSFISSIFIFTNLVHLCRVLREKAKFKIIFFLHLFSEEGEKVYRGLGSAVYTYKHTGEDEKGKAKTVTEKVTLPVTLDSEQADDEDDDEQP